MRSDLSRRAERQGERAVKQLANAAANMYGAAMKCRRDGNSEMAATLEALSDEMIKLGQRASRAVWTI